MRSPPVFVLYGQCLLAGMALQLAVSSLGVDRRQAGLRHQPIYAIWASAMAAVLLVNTIVFEVADQHVELALFVRTIALVGAGVLTPVVLVRVGDVEVPRWVIPAVIAAGVVRVALWPTTDLVYTHTLDAAGNPVYGPALGLMTAPILLLALWVASRATRALPSRTDTWMLAVAMLLAIVLVLTSILVSRGPGSEVLSALWTVPLLVALDVIDRRQAREHVAARQRVEADRLTAATQLAEANAELARTLDLRDSLIAMTSHELRTPLTPLRGMLETVLGNSDRMTEQQRRDALETAIRNARRLETLVDELLTASQARAGLLAPRPTVTAAADLVQEIVQVWPEVTEVSIEPADLQVVVDRQHAHQILANLVTNAVKYGAAPIGIEVRARAGRAEFCVHDAGDGVPEEFIDHLFEPFTQASTGTSRTGSGVGLGLSISQTLAEASGGELAYCPDAGRSCFCLRLPLAGPR